MKRSRNFQTQVKIYSSQQLRKDEAGYSSEIEVSHELHHLWVDPIRALVIQTKLNTTLIFQFKVEVVRLSAATPCQSTGTLRGKISN